MWDSFNSFIDSAAQTLPDTSELFANTSEIIANTSEIITNASNDLNTFVSESTGGKINLENIENAVQNKLDQATKFVANALEDLDPDNKPHNPKIQNQLKQRDDALKKQILPWSTLNRDEVLEAKLKDQILFLSTQERELFEKPMPEDAEYMNIKSLIPIAYMVLEMDKNLVRIRKKLVISEEKQMNDKQFWKKYFYGINRIRKSLNAKPLTDSFMTLYENLYLQEEVDQEWGNWSAGWTDEEKSIESNTKQPTIREKKSKQENEKTEIERETIEVESKKVEEKEEKSMYQKLKEQEEVSQIENFEILDEKNAEEEEEVKNSEQNVSESTVAKKESLKIEENDAAVKVQEIEEKEAKEEESESSGMEDLENMLENISEDDGENFEDDLMSLLDED